MGLLQTLNLVIPIKLEQRVMQGQCVFTLLSCEAQVRSVSLPVLGNQKDSTESWYLNWALPGE